MGFTQREPMHSTGRSCQELGPGLPRWLPCPLLEPRAVLNQTQISRMGGHREQRALCWERGRLPAPGTLAQERE